MSLLTIGPEWGVPYKLTGPDGTVAWFNCLPGSTTEEQESYSYGGEAGALYCGILDPEESSGLGDDAEIRENSSEKTEQDGAVFGNFYRGKRPIILGGIIHPGLSATQRNERAGRIRRAAAALRPDAWLNYNFGYSTIEWTPLGGEALKVEVRKQQPIRFTGQFIKKFLIAFVAPDPRIYAKAPTSGETKEKTTEKLELTLENKGDMETANLSEIKFYGPIKKKGTVKVECEFAGGATRWIELLNVPVMTKSEYIAINLANRTVNKNGSENVYNLVNFSNSSWFLFPPGSFTIKVKYENYQYKTEETEGSTEAEKKERHITAQLYSAWS